MKIICALPLVILLSYIWFCTTDVLITVEASQASRERVSMVLRQQGDVFGSEVCDVAACLRCPP